MITLLFLLPPGFSLNKHQDPLGIRLFIELPTTRATKCPFCSLNESGNSTQSYSSTCCSDRVKLHYFGVNEFLERFEDEDIKGQATAPVKKSKEKSDYHQTKEQNSKVKKLENRIKKAEIEVEILEAEIAVKTVELEGTNYEEKSNYQDLVKAIEKIQATLDSELKIWEESSEELEAIKTS